MAEPSERTPNMSTIRHAWAKGHPFPLTTDVEERYAEFDRALAAHDAEVREAQADHDAIRINDLDTRLVAAERELAEVRAGVVAEEPEWEYEVTYSSASAPSIDGYRLRRSSGMLPSLAAAMEWVGFSVNPMVHRRTKAVPAGEWEHVPVKQEGASTDG